MCFLKNSYFWPKSLFQSSYFLMHFISVLNFCMFMMIVKIFCCTIYFAFHFLPKLISSPFSGSGRNCGVLWPRQIEGASPCFLGCCILSEDMRVWGGIWAVCVCAREHVEVSVYLPPTLTPQLWGWEWQEQATNETNFPQLTITVVCPLPHGPGEPTLRTERQVDVWPLVGSLVVILKC